jgi:hypothetical protein
MTSVVPWLFEYIRAENNELRRTEGDIKTVQKQALNTHSGDTFGKVSPLVLCSQRNYCACSVNTFIQFSPPLRVFSVTWRAFLCVNY